MTAGREIAPAKLNLGLHVRGRLPDGRHAIETLFAFCTDGDWLSAEPADELSLEVTGFFAGELSKADDNLVMKAARALAEKAEVSQGAAMVLDKRLPIASGIGGGSADAAAALRLLTSLWRIDPTHASAVAPSIGSDVPACLLSFPIRGEGAGDRLEPIQLPELSGKPALLVNPRVQLETGEVFGAWDGVDHGPLENWQDSRNDLQATATRMVPQIETVLAWLAAQPGAEFIRMSGSGATCFALMESEEQLERAADAVPREWWHLATSLR